MKNILIALTVLCLLVSCNDFVDVVPKGNTIPETVDDLGKMMADGGMSMTNPMASFSYCVNYIEAYSDDYTASENPNSAYYTNHKTISFYVSVLTWADYIFTIAEDDYNWNGLYRSNYVTNYVLANIDEVEEGIDYQRNEVKGQALVHRAMNFFLLVNLYAKQYDAATAETDLGVPLILEPDINNQYPRETVAKVYEQILGDLTEALTLLTVDVPEYNNVPGRATAYALRARVYLWMQNYDQAYADATEALKLRSEIIDYNTCSQLMPGIPAYGINGYSTIPQTNPEIMYSRYRTERSTMMFSQKMMDIIDTENDLRYTLFYGSYEAAGILDPMMWTRLCHSGIDVSEVWLTKAEAALRKSNPDIQEAIEALDYVRDRRYLNQNYTAAPTDPDDLLVEILNERRREITFTEMSFLDHKRQNADPKTARPMERTVWGETYTLPVGDPRWQLAIPLNVCDLNPLLKQNER